jgi:hypothetical protein
MTIEKPAIGSIWRNGIIAAVAVAVVNALIYLLGAATGNMPQDVLTPQGTPITLALMVIMSIVPLLIGTFAYMILTRFTAKPLANRIFVVVSILLLILMAISPLQLAGAPIGMVVILEVVHLIAGGVLIYALTRV